MKPNNVNVDAVMAFVAEAKADPSLLRKSKRVEGVWNLVDGRPQYASTMASPKGETRVEADLAPFMGGEGLAPDPIQYCLFGLSACFAGTFAAVASEKGVTLRSMKVIVENKVNLSRAFGLGDAPVVEEVTISVVADSDASDEALAEVEKATRERCPGVYCLTQPIPLTTTVKGV